MNNPQYSSAALPPADEQGWCVAPASDEPDLQARANELSLKWQLKLLPCPPAGNADEGEEAHAIIIVEAEGLSLEIPHAEIAGGLKLDFSSGPVAHRHRTATAGQPLGRALGLRGKDANSRPDILDTTAGLGRDALSMAGLGCRVVAVERHPLLYLLLQDAWRRAASSREESLMEITRKLGFVHSDSQTLCRSLAQTGGMVTEITGGEDIFWLGEWLPEVIYLDPMYPEKRKKSSRPKKELVILQHLLGAAGDVEELFQATMSATAGRVVVKRPPNAKALGKVAPTHQYGSKMVRYDVYVK